LGGMDLKVPPSPPLSPYHRWLADGHIDVVVCVCVCVCVCARA
jgi:hypothetical protein